MSGESWLPCHNEGPSLNGKKKREEIMLVNQNNIC